MTIGNWKTDFSFVSELYASFGTKKLLFLKGRGGGGTHVVNEDRGKN